MAGPSTFAWRRAALATIVSIGWLASAVPATAADTVVFKALQFVACQQRDDGGFGSGESGFAGFETPDAVMAIASAAQTTSSWSTTEALAAVEAVTHKGHSPLHYLDDWADGVYGTIGAGPAARIALVASRLGLDSAHFDPDGDGAVDLLATIAAGEHADHTWGAGAFNTTLAAVLGIDAAGRSVDSATLQAIQDAQEASGSWDYQGDPAGTDADPDTTGLAVEALIATGSQPASLPVVKALAFLARTLDASGAWHDSYADTANPNSTAMAVLAIRAAGGDPATSAWRDAAAPELTGTAYHSPLAWLAAHQASDGHIASPNDQYGVNTFGTTQAVEAFAAGQHLGIAPAAIACPDNLPTTTTTVAATTSTVAAQGSTSTSASDSSTTTTSSVGGSGPTLPVTGAPSRTGRDATVAGAILLLGGMFAVTGRRRRRTA